MTMQGFVFTVHDFIKIFIKMVFSIFRYEMKRYNLEYKNLKYQTLPVTKQSE